MAQQTPSDVVRQASTWSIVWGVLLIVLGAMAVGSGGCWSGSPTSLLACI
jgi:hypothetical protein